MTGRVLRGLFARVCRERTSKTVPEAAPPRRFAISHASLWSAMQKKKQKRRKKRSRSKQQDGPRAAGAATLRASFPLQGLAGSHAWVAIRPVTATTPREEIAWTPPSGRYAVTLTLARPGAIPSADNDISLREDIPGDSHIAVSQPALAPPAAAASIRLYVMAPGRSPIRVEGLPNAKGFLGTLRLELDAAGPIHAEANAYGLVAPMLSCWSVNLDVPVLLWRVLVRHLASGAVFARMRYPYVGRPFHVVPRTEMSEDFRGVAALYREALVGSSQVYEYLCLFKITELIRARRGRQDQATRQAGGTPTRPRERVPQNPDELAALLRGVLVAAGQWREPTLDALLPAEARGRKYLDLLDAELRTLRNDVAHAVSDKGDLTIMFDEAQQTERLWRWLPLMRVMVRRMIKNDFPDEFLPSLLDDGTIDEAKARSLAETTAAFARLSTAPTLG
jgi:hypothetical protein